MNTRASTEKLRRVTVYLPPDDYKQLRAFLILNNTTVSAWIRATIKLQLVSYQQEPEGGDTQ